MYWRDVASHCNIPIPFTDAIVLLSPEMELKIAAASNTPPWQSELSALPEEQKIDRLVSRLGSFVTVFNISQGRQLPNNVFFSPAAPANSQNP